MTPSLSHSAEADAKFLLTVLHVGEVELVSARDLQRHGPVNPQLLTKTVSCLVELQLINEVVCLAAGLLPRACCLRNERRIFPADSEWYDEAETPLATIAVALRVAQLFLEGEVHGNTTFYTAWGFYPYEDLARFARVLGDAEVKTPVANVEWDRWCSLKRDFEEVLGIRQDEAGVQVRW